MKIKYDSKADILNLKLSEKKIIESDEVKEGIIFDYDKDGNVVSIEILDASEKVDNPLSTTVESLSSNEQS